MTDRLPPNDSNLAHIECTPLPTSPSLVEQTALHLRTYGKRHTATTHTYTCKIKDAKEKRKNETNLKLEL